MSGSPIDEARLRHPLERPIFVASAAVSAGLAAAAIVVVLLGTEWLAADHPVLDKHIGTVRLAAVAAVLSAPAAHVLRRTRRVLYLGNSVRLSAEQLPGVHGILEARCARLGIVPVPELYLCRTLGGGEVAPGVLGPRA